MTANNLQEVAAQVVRLAQKQGYVVPREVRAELAQASIAESLWKDVLALARASLSYRRGRYYYTPPVSERVRAEQSQQSNVQAAVRNLVEAHQVDAGRVERREQGRVDFIQPVKVVVEDGREFTLLTRDLSETGIRLIGTRRLLGQKVRVLIPAGKGPPLDFQVRILWTCPVGDDLVENGGTFLSVGQGQETEGKKR
jgi:hypothetical protein